MQRIHAIDSPSNPTIKALHALRQRRMREREGRYLIEGIREVQRAAAGWAQLEQLIYCPALLKDSAQVLTGLPSLERLELSQRAFAKLSQRQNPDGLMALARINDIPSPALAKDALLLVLESIEKPGNLGALLRSADAVGVAQVLVTGTGTDLYNPNVIRASMGSLFACSVRCLETLEAIAWLQQQSVSIVATSLQAQHSYWHSQLGGKVAIVLGSEAEGLTQPWLQAADQQVIIPMRSEADSRGIADSLNVATAGALLLYEALRQRTMPG